MDFRSKASFVGNLLVFGALRQKDVLFFEGRPKNEDTRVVSDVGWLGSPFQFSFWAMLGASVDRAFLRSVNSIS